MKVMIGYIHGGVLENDFVTSLFTLLAYDSNHARLFDKVQPIRGAYLDDNRNEVVRVFMERQDKYLLFLDTDHKFSPEVIYGLIDEAERNELSILSALYFGFVADGNLRPVWFVPPREGEGIVATIGSFQTNQLIPLAAAGMGCCLIRRDVFETMGATHADDAWPWFGRDQYEHKGKKYAYGEDICFCIRASKLGFQTWGHSGLMVGHIKAANMDFDMFQMLLEKNPDLGSSTATGGFGMKL
jgi:GT2 family glycosyltransferase